jgi:opacity protein-like surface antigen
LKIFAALSVSVVFAAGCAMAQDSQQAPQPAPQQAPQQGQAAPAGSSSSSSSSAPAAPSERRFSGGVTLEVYGFHQIDGRTFTNYTSTSLNTQYQTSNASERLGYGLTAQARIRGHFYLNVSGILHRLGYEETTTVSTTTIEVLNGSTYPSISTTSTHEDTRSYAIDIPALLRYYGTGKRPGSPRWFLEIGGEYQMLESIRTSVDAVNSSGTITGYTYTPATPQRNAIYGPVVGAGIQFTDEFGIHVTPEVRYTRWMESNFNYLSTTGNRQQIEADISITF